MTLLLRLASVIALLGALLLAADVASMAATMQALTATNGAPNHDNAR